MRTLVLLISVMACTCSRGQVSLDWVNTTGGTGSESGAAVALDDNGNVFVTGSFSGTVDFDPSPGTWPLTTGASDIYIQKFDAAGALLWAAATDGSMSASSFDIISDVAGNVYVTGQFYGTVDFQPGPGITQLTAIGGQDVFVLKLDASGNFDWVSAVGGSSSDIPRGMAIDDQGNIYATGSFYNTVDFDPGPGAMNLTSSGNSDIFVLKLDPMGDLVWARKMGGSGFESGNAIAVSSTGSVYITGQFQGTSDLDPGSGTATFISNGGNDIFIEKLDPQGNYEWALSGGSGSSEAGSAIVLDPTSNVYVSGDFQNTVDFDFGPGGTLNITSAGNKDIFVKKLDSLGNLKWVRTMGGTNLDKGKCLALDPSGNVYLTGTFQGMVDLDPGAGIHPIGSEGSHDVFSEKLDTNGNFLWGFGMGSSSVDDGNAITISPGGDVYVVGEFQDTLVDFDPGSGTIPGYSTGSYDAFLQKLTQCSPAMDSITVATCQSYTVPSGNHTYVTSGLYADTLVNVEGCDSILMIDLTINQPSSATIIETACDSYTLPSGSQTYFTSGTYFDTISNTTGCDSTMAINVTIVTVDTSVIVSGITLTANQIGAQYQWLDCGTLTPLIGETSQNYTALANGAYSVGVTLNGCTDTSACHLITSVSIGERNPLEISIYPNPAAGFTTLDLGQVENNTQVTIYTAGGRIMSRTRFTGRKLILDTAFDPGYYLVEVLTNRGYRRVVSLVKQ